MDLMARTKPPKQLLHPKFHAPPYMVDPVTKLAGQFHLPPYNAEEQAAIGEAKVAADKSGKQTRADLVFPNLLIGNMYAAQDARYLAIQVHHVLHKNTIPDICHFFTRAKGAGASEAGGQTKRDLSANDTSRHPKLLKIGPNHQCQ